MSSYCPTCGASIHADQTICPTCGEPIDGSAQTDESIGVPNTMPTPSMQEPQAAMPAGPGALPQMPGATKPSAMRDYILAGVASLVIAGLAFVIAAPDWYEAKPGMAQTNPAAAAGHGDGMPHDHPEVNQQPQQVPPEVEKQIADLEKSVADNPKDLPAKLKLANLYFDVGRHEKAVPLYNEYVAANPDDDDARTDMAFSMANTGQIEGSVAELKRVIARSPKHQNAAYNLAMMYVSKRDRDSAVYWLEQVQAIDSTTRQGKFASNILQGLKEEPAPPRPEAAQ